LFEWFLKNDELGDPLVNEDHILSFGWAEPDQIAQVRECSLRANRVLSELFLGIGITLVDFKLEFGAGTDGALYLGDEFTPDGCRLWDAQTQEVLDKDRFRHDMGAVVDAYEQVARRLSQTEGQ
ncbi:MAG: phosphoribosylaminoimidazolesuccinocarboxamide synthase, partial [Gammaproteobacteria bacterium AqS3]|nr:phosphoribosylaminoimidazolesuccinocarboxamide synthase [Gammaproteobacteria bacterium AqS3]